MTEATDWELITAYRAGDLEAFDRLVERHQSSLFGYILNMGGRPSDADDVFQDVWMKALRKLDLFRRDGSFGGWLVRIARNVMIDRSRRRGGDSLSLDAEGTEGGRLLDTLKSGMAEPGEAVTASELGVRLAEAVARLPDEQREVFLLRSQTDLPFREIAAIQGVSINTALARMRYALDRLRGVLRVDYEGLARG